MLCLSRLRASWQRPIIAPKLPANPTLKAAGSRPDMAGRIACGRAYEHAMYDGQGKTFYGAFEIQSFVIWGDIL